MDLIEGDKELSEIPSSQRRPMAKPLADYFKGRVSRNEGIIKAYASGGYSMKKIGDYVGLHYATISGIIKNHKSKT